MAQRPSSASAAAAVAEVAVAQKFMEKAERVAEAVKTEHDARSKIAENATKPMPPPDMTPVPAGEKSKCDSIEAELARPPLKKGLFAQLL